ncbi:MAG TPA: hypothetical protein VEG34_07325 [Thermoanaerobaculia bacterium]|nr:hypothetical protein [Thermoanaerobaculia bacterium]
MATISNSHARPAAFRRMVRGGSASPGEVQVIVRHLLAGCETCQRRMAEARDAGGDHATWSYDAVFSRLARRPSEGERQERTMTAHYEHVHP